MLIEAKNVTKAFGAFKAVDDASVSVEEGDILGLIGPNGAGKSTFFNCLTGDLPLTSGTVRFAGAEVTRLPPEARAALGLARTFQVPLTFESMSVLDNATIGALLRHANAREARAKARDVLQRVGLGPLADSPAKSLGTPGRKRLEIARALASEPQALLLDEAMAGLTPTEVREAIELVRRMPRDRPWHAARGDQQPGGDRSLSRPPQGAPRDGPMSAPLLRVSHLEVRYGDLVGVADVSLEVPAGSVVALLGSNGAGKTTTLNAIAGIAVVSKGTVEFGGENIAGQPAYAIVRKGLALSPEGWRLFTQQSVENNLMLGATALADRARVPRLLERVYAVFPRLAERRRQRAGTMSGGERQMLAVGRALMSEPELLLLDEPSLGLAPAIVDAMYDAFAALHKDGQTILLAEQSVDLALEAADHAYVLQVGRTVLQGPAREMAHNPDVQKVYLGIE